MLESMLRLQQKLNDETNGKDWEKGYTNQGKKIDWRRCIWLEAAELVDSYPWKHWKSINAKPDYENIKIEAVDIWHFVMSEALRKNKIEANGDISELAKNISNTQAYRDFVNTKSSTEKKDIYDEIDIVEEFVGKLFNNSSIEEITSSFFKVAKIANLDINTLYRLYIGKNILNIFRQNHGYKEGTYQKIWNGKEDNVTMQNILDKNPSISPDELYKALEKVYPNI